jgi:hypothetical protein
MLRYVFAIVLSLCAAAFAQAQQPRPAALDPEHREFATVLARVVSTAGVDYRDLQRDRAALDRYRAQLAAVPPAALVSAERNVAMALWINAYNAFVLATIIDAYPIKRGSLVGVAFPSNSIWQISGAFTRKQHSIAGKKYSLEDIEHEILRPRFRDPRIHMALVCAAKACPPLRSEPYVAARLDVQLDEQSRVFLQNRTYGLRFDAAQRRIEVSAIFKWFKEDFLVPGEKSTEAGLRAFLARHLTDAQYRSAALNRDTALAFLDYDWRLNER